MRGNEQTYLDMQENKDENSADVNLRDSISRSRNKNRITYISSTVNQSNIAFGGRPSREKVMTDSGVFSQSYDHGRNHGDCDETLDTDYDVPPKRDTLLPHHVPEMSTSEQDSRGSTEPYVDMNTETPLTAEAPIYEDYVVLKSNLRSIPSEENPNRLTCTIPAPFEMRRKASTRLNQSNGDNVVEQPRHSESIYAHLYDLKISPPSNHIYSDLKELPNSAVYYTQELLILRVFHGFITDCPFPVDCMVNPTNPWLNDKSSASSYTLARKAGPSFEEACTKAVHNHGGFRVTECCCTPPGDLPCSWVINVISSRAEDCKDTVELQDLTYMSLLNCFQKMEDLKMASLAIPNINAGSFGLSKEAFAQTYCEAVSEFSRTHSETERSLKVIYFVDVSKELVKEVDDIFANTFAKNTSELFLPEKIDISPDAKVGQCPQLLASFRLEMSQALSKPLPSVFDLGKGVRVLVYTHDIRKAETDAILCPEDIHSKTGGRMAAAIKQAFRSSFRKTNHEKLVTTKASSTKSPKPLQVITSISGTDVPKYIIHEVVPIWTTSQEEPVDFIESLVLAIGRVFDCLKRSKLRVKSISIPILGIDNINHSPVSKCCNVLAEEIKNVCLNSSRRPKVLEEIHIVCQCREIALAVDGYFQMFKVQMSSE